MRKTINTFRDLPAVITLICLVACQAEPRGIRLTPEGSGPRVRFDLDAKPLPEIPFPNDVATRPDATSATGLRVNASLLAPTRMEKTIREKIDRLDGFGVFQPISVSFDEPLDIEDLLSRHQEDLDFSNDAVYLINVDPQSPGYGHPVFLDIGRGNFPLWLQTSNRYFAADPRAQAGNVVFDTVEEDLNENGVLDPGEDTDDDGILDHPNVWPPGSDPQDGLMNYYESETNTLILRPVVPLKEQTRYAVVLTERLRGRLRDKQPVRSPFKWVHHISQSEEIERLDEIFEAWEQDGTELTTENVAFAWVFTTQTVTADLVAIREGLYGIGPLSWLAESFSDDVAPALAKNEDDTLNYLLEAERVVDIVNLLGPLLFGDNFKYAEPVIDTFRYLDYFVSGSFESPDFVRTANDSLNQENLHRENFAINLNKGEADVDTTQIYFTMAIPKETDRYHPPFPVVLYCHGYGSFRIEALVFAGMMARRGLATVGIEAWGHSLPIQDEIVMEMIMSVTNSWGFGPFAEALLNGRARDLDGDGAMDSGGDYFTAYGFHTRDVIRQSIVDHIQLVRALRSFDGVRNFELDQNGNGLEGLAGDFNADGRVDAGGPGVDYFAWGQSMGGIHASVIGPLEPFIIATAPTVGGGGLSDIGLRTSLGTVIHAVMLRSMGPLVVGEPVSEGTIQVSLLGPLSHDERKLVVGEVHDVRAGDQVVVEVWNDDKQEEYIATIHEGLKFRVSMAADIDDYFRVIFRDDRGEDIATLDHWSQNVWYWNIDEPTYLAGDDLQTPTEGYGMARCTPDLRKMIALFQMILDPADPANYAPHYFLDPLDIQPEGKTVTNLLEISSVGDQAVPINTQATLGRAAGVIPYLAKDPRYEMSVNDWLIKNHVYEGLVGLGRFPENDVLFDPDDLDEGTDGFDAPAPERDEDRLRIKVKTETGESGIRFAYINPAGQHGLFPTVDFDFDMFTYFLNLISYYFASKGTEILDDVCLETMSCPQ